MTMNVADKAKIADAKTTEALLETLPDNFLMCRDLRHAWGVLNDFYVYNDPKQTRLLVIARDLVCLRCNSERREVFVQRSWGLDKERNTYTYVEGYSLKGVPRGTKASQVVHDVQYRKAMTKVAAAAKEAGQR